MAAHRNSHTPSYYTVGTHTWSSHIHFLQPIPFKASYFVHLGALELFYTSAGVRPLFIYSPAAHRKGHDAWKFVNRMLQLLDLCWTQQSKCNGLITPPIITMIDGPDTCTIVSQTDLHLDNTCRAVIRHHL